MYSAQQCLLVIIEKFKEAMDKGHKFGAFLTVMSKAFDIIGHKPLHAKLYSYGISLSSINLLSSYWTIEQNELKSKTVPV